ncbi:preprotein translocase subunit SecA [Nitratidesulfovibrio liaohensis]|uniref:Protein translocase subunit SecA n=1 Tax=Nitratidesulfovibrio liaohensis TaxID=2604158 RepID=A0ABY9R2G8_9BACT|nr:preprotein translocase subunit SecA [Nitratidesulfovibrio liaohensis]WMW65208.1 preprotein translocase subunit SecA [Nitratidesulfovibrio liaohensis]
MFDTLFKSIFGSSNDRYIKRCRTRVEAINALEPQMQALADADFPARIAEYREQAQNGRSLDDLLPEVFALTREAGKRALNMRHFDVQLVGGMVLHEGRIAEMKTGEGKTLVATLPVVLNAISGLGVHVVTVNDYLAKRDSAWMGRLYNFLGLSVGVIVHGLSDEERKEAYGADITYGTNNEFGFDYLRDNMKFYPHQLVQREHNFAIVDEVDSILIDEARTPLIISGPSEDSTGLYRRVDDIIPKLSAEAHFSVDEKARTATLTDEGVARCEELLGIDNLFDPGNITFQHHVLQALKAHHVFRRDVDYIVTPEDQVVIVDEFTGRLMPGRRFSDGLHQALEAKEKVKVEAENQTLASITFQNYFRMYKKLAGMTGTADTEAVEFQQIYGLQVITIPTNKPMVRKDYPDSIYRTRREKFEAIVAAIGELHKSGQPVLVGTISIETSELLSAMLKKTGVPHNVLNAKHHEQEAEIVAQAGQRGKVTIATNMAGRGTDIVLGEGVRESGGLHILGTERHESRRIDNQLRGRSGRQGDPGSSRFYLSLEDDLMRLFGSDRISGLMQKLGMEEGEPIENRMVSRAIENAQKRVEGHNFEIRKTLLDYDNVMNQQREVIYTLRRETMMEADLEETAVEFMDDLFDEIYGDVEQGKGSEGDDAKAYAMARLRDVFNITRVLPLTDGQLPDRETARGAVLSILDEMKRDTGEVYRDILRFFLLEEVDRCWKEHLLNMDHLRDGIGLRGYGQRDPKQEYKREGFELFQEMLFRVRENLFRALTRLRIQREEQAPPEELKQEFKHKEEPKSLNYSGAQKETPSATPERRGEPKVGRNDPCPCGSGQKYKKCCGA